MGEPVHPNTPAAEAAYVPFAGPITLDTLDALFASKATTYGGFTMKADDDDDDDDDEGDDDDTPGLGDDDDDDKGGDDDEGDDGDEPLGKAGKKALLAERARNKTLRKRLREATAAAAAKPKGKAGKDDDDDDDDPEAKAAAKWKPKVVNSAAKAALLSAGAEKPERLLRLIEHDDLEVTDDGDVHGLDDEVERLKDEYPELFAKPGRKRAARVETGDRSTGNGTKKKMTATERQAALLRGGK